MSKRTATRELNHDNWDDDEEEEEAGSFQPASSEALQGRVIKQARRRLTANDGEAKKNVFSGFAGFGARTTPSANAFNINFAAKVPSDNGVSSETTSATDSKEKEYLASLKVLNETVTTWITDHVKKNPCCVLTPIFQDYEKHLKDLESKRCKEKKSETLTTTPAVENEEKKFQFGSGTAEKPAALNFFGNGSAKPLSSTPVATSSSTFSFKGVQSESVETVAPSSMFSFKGTASNSSATSPAPFSFSATKPAPPPAAFSFGFASKPSSVTEAKKDEDEEEEDEDAPPKVEVKQVQEDDAFYSIRCKLFYKKDSSYAEKGVGTLHLKKVKDDKTQLVVRADTSLGNILLNILLNPQLTTQRVGKNNVMLVCIPNPPIDPKTPSVPTPMLLRVKTDVEADELLAKLNEAKAAE